MHFGGVYLINSNTIISDDVFSSTPSLRISTNNFIQVFYVLKQVSTYHVLGVLAAIIKTVFIIATIAIIRFKAAAAELDQNVPSGLTEKRSSGVSLTIFTDSSHRFLAFSSSIAVALNVASLQSIKYFPVTLTTSSEVANSTFSQISGGFLTNSAISSSNDNSFAFHVNLMTIDTSMRQLDEFSEH
uniref:Uncharacterized protein n=1 Tax=Glossina austeni TaxID=7395 RepID=A0A1A9VER7_GLOAU